MPTDTELFKATTGFCLSGSLERHTIEPHDEFHLALDVNKFGPGRKMVSVFDLNGNLLGYVTTGQAEIIRQGGG